MLPQRCTVEASRRGRWRSKGERSRRGLHKRRRWEVWSGPAYEVRPCGGVWRGVVHNGAPKKNYKKFSFTATMIGQGPGDRGLKKKSTKSCQGRFFECNSFYHFIEDLSHHFFRHVVAVLDVFSSDSVVVASFPIMTKVETRITHAIGNLRRCVL